ncbi:sensor domain-containing diguanylate cyclase [Ectopseudomonas mendocina]|uniref:sensor domain-containing diguanylate cyclase n=1 Tax=Ectopseudomonas mendocina TaxID=300 RepID=UPI0023EDC0B0|nr:sensor domain-containing diguanylate cyclase [Pseudomonas mendocina]
MKHGTRLASILLLFICLSLALLTTWQIWFSRERALNDLNVANLNLAHALDKYSEGVIRQSELVLVDLAERLEQEGKDRAHLERLQKLVQQQSQVLKLASTIIIYNAQGDRLLVSRGDINARPNAADRLFFIHHRDNPSPETFIGPTIRSRLNGDWIFTVSRRLNDADGSFSGVVAITLSVEQYLQLFGSLDLGRQGVMSLSTSDGILLFRQPFREQDVGLDWSSSPIFQMLRERDHALTTQISRLDGVERLYAFRRNSNMPLITMVALGRDEALTAWRRDARLFATVVMILLLAVGFIGQRLLVDVRRRSRVERQLLIAREELLDANARLEILASQDALTGLANRRCFDQALEVEIRRAHRRGSHLALMLLDIDLFKRYNDHYGHLAGDECLRNVANVLKQCMRRPGDLAARYGGEELVVILPNTTAEGAEAVALGFMESLAQCNLPHQGSPFHRITVSVGVASLIPGPQDSASLAVSLIEAADQALYRAKANGRNRLEINELPGAPEQ